ncbi:MAG: hypothetical protein EOO18_10160, partial [Chryseobacterium sp.]
MDDDGPGISYSEKPLKDEIHFEETPLLSQTGVTKQELFFASYENYEVPFPIIPSLFPFDVFAASFFLVSRYEEYAHQEKDAHGRFEAKSSLAFRKNFLGKPVIDEWAIKILNHLRARFPEIPHRKRAFIFQPTLDIDSAYYIRTETPLRQFLKAGRLVLNSFWKGFVKDPFDVYDEVLIWDKEFSTKTIFFMLMNDQHMYDGRENKKHKLFSSLVQRLKRDFIVGLHPSYSSNEIDGNLAVEKRALETLVSEEVIVSRQHYLKLTFPATYTNLLKNNINEDWTMLYADLPGFRASTCTAFLWYNLSEEKKTILSIQPAALMDQTLRKYMGLSREGAIVEIDKLMRSVKNVNGTFVSLWHNESVSGFGVWKGWKQVEFDLGTASVTQTWPQ